MSSVLLFGCFLSKAWGCFIFFCTEVVVYIASPYFCERQTDDVIGAEVCEEAGPGGWLFYYQIFRKNYERYVLVLIEVLRL